MLVRLLPTTQALCAYHADIQKGQSFGIVFGLGVAGAVFQTKGVAYVSPILSDLPSSDVRAAIAGTSSAIYNGLSDSTRALVVQAITRAIDKVYILVIATGALTFVLACFLPVSNFQANKLLFPRRLSGC